ELYLVVHRFKPSPIVHRVAHLCIAFVFILPYLAPWANVGIRGMSEEDAADLEIEDASGMLTLLVVVVVALAVTVRVCFEIGLVIMICCRISALRAIIRMDIPRPQLIALNTITTATTASSASSSPSLPTLRPPLIALNTITATTSTTSSSSSSSSSLPPILSFSSRASSSRTAPVLVEDEQRAHQAHHLYLSLKILFYLITYGALSIVNSISLDGEVPQSTVLQVGLLIQLTICLFTYFWLDANTWVPLRLPPSFLHYLYRRLLAPNGRVQEREEEEEEGEVMEVEDGGMAVDERRRKGRKGLTASESKNKWREKRQQLMLRGKHKKEDEMEEGEKDDKEGEERGEMGKERCYTARADAAAATAAAAAEREYPEETDVDTVLPSRSPRTLYLAYAISSGARVTDKSSYGQGGGGIGRCGSVASSRSEKSGEYGKMQRALFEPKWMEGLAEKEEEGTEEDRGGGGGGGGGMGGRD
ncbi:hypothetical protein VYU27_010416, partial [Nannochloropsis oceanica]